MGPDDSVTPVTGADTRTIDTPEPARVGLVFDDRCLTFNTGLGLIEYRDPFPFAEPVPHVSSPALVGRAKHLLDLHGLTDNLEPIAAYEADDDALGVYHTHEYIARVVALGRTGGDAGNGAPLGIGGDRLARLAAGSAMAAVDGVMTSRVRAAYALVRPPGHHAMADRGMGFCVFNNPVVAARHAQRAHRAEKILILDWDVHHGNGTQDAFYADQSVLFISIHQDDLFPAGWGRVEQTGTGQGEGFTVNVPLPAGTGSRGYREAFERLVLPIARQFSPDLVIVSAGQDASVLDPLGRMTLTTAAYREFTRMMMDLTAETCGGRLVLTQEGGYAPTYAPYCTAAIVETLIGAASGITPVGDPYGARAESMPTTRELGLDVARSLDLAMTVLRRYWSV